MQGFILDGFPIDADQASQFEADIASPKAIVFLEAPDAVLAERLTGRGNFDDNKASIEKRIANFNANTLPVVEKYGDKVNERLRFSKANRRITLRLCHKSNV